MIVGVLEGDLAKEGAECVVGIGMPASRIV